VTLSVIVPTFNRRVLLVQALRSLLRQSGEIPLDVLVVDDGSTDGTGAAVSEMRRRKPELRYIFKNNAGVTTARNTGLSNLLSETQFVSFLDSDDCSPSGALSKQMGALAKAPGAKLAYGRLTLADEIEEKTLVPRAGGRTHTLTGISMSAALMRRELVDQIGKFDPDFRQSEDVDYLLRIFESGAEFVETDTVCCYYRRHEGNMTKKSREARRYFMLALHKSMLRRREKPGVPLKKPSFEIKQLLETPFA